MLTQRDPRFDFSGGIQNATTWQLRRPNEVEDAINGRFNDTIGAITRRPGYEEDSVIEEGKPGLGLYEAKWESGATLLAAANNAGDTKTNIKMYDGVSSWSPLTLPADIDPNTQVQFSDSLGETYAAGMDDTGERMDLLNIVDGGTVSNTRNLLFAPDARFITEFGGNLYAMNVKLNGVVYADRAYRSSPAMGIITFTQGEQAVFDEIKVDTVRYLKPTMDVDVYLAETATKIADINITSVNKAENIFIYSASTASTFATGDVNTGTDVITVGRNIATGAPIKFTSTTTVPAGLTAGTVYYAINVSATTIKVATTHANALAGTAVDITSTGSGTHTVTSGVYFPDNSEIWLNNRHGELYYLWNTDYPTEQQAEYLRIPPGVDADSAIVGWGKTNNRLFLFTENSTYKWDNAQLPTVYEDIGCASHNTIQNIGDWLLWLDSEGRVQARNDATGQEEIISRSISNLISQVPGANLSSASAGRIHNVYKLCLGTVGDSILRLCYDFDANTWSHETHTLRMTNFIRTAFSDNVKQLVFVSDGGHVYIDEVGTTDNGVTIPFIVTFGRTNQNIEQMKNYHGVYVYARNIAGSSVKVGLDGQQPTDMGQLKYEVTKVAFSGIKAQSSGRDINLEISINSKGESPSIDAVIYYFSQEEDKFGQPTTK